jgi:hypothetical protein
MANETFVPRGSLAPDFASAGNWSGGTVPGLGTIAVLAGVTASVDPQTSLSAHIILQGDAALSGNDGGFLLGLGSAVEVAGANALFGDGAVVNHGAISLGEGAALRVVVENGADGIAQSYGLEVPSFENLGRISIGAGAVLAVDGTEFSNQGHILIDGGTLKISGGGVDGGQNSEPGGGNITLTSGGTAIFEDAVANQEIDFAGEGTLVIAHVQDIANVRLDGFSTGSALLVDSVADANTLLARLNFSGGAPVVVATPHGAAIEYAATPCFARGTELLTPLGYVPVEQFRPGDPVVTVGGAVRPVRWVGSRTIDIAAHPRPGAVRPVIVTPDAIAAGVPRRAARFSPDHALLLHGLLVPVKLLVNGATILWDHACQAVSYFHVELDRHDIVLAENLPAESYLDTGNRAMFAQSHGNPHRAPAFGRGKQWDAAAYADLCLKGAKLGEIRRDLRAQAMALGFAVRTLTEVSLWVAGQKYLPAGGSVERPIFRFLKSHPGRAAIRSAKFVPAEFAAGNDDEEDDLRCLGVAISRIRLGHQGFAPRDLEISGFHRRAAGDPADWTDGNAVIAVPADVDTVTLMIEALPQAWVRQGV